MSRQRSDAPEKLAVNDQRRVFLRGNETEIARTVALKNEPRFAADAIEKVGRGMRVTVLSKERDWIQVKVKSSGTVGYMRKEYLRRISLASVDRPCSCGVNVDSGIQR